MNVDIGLVQATRAYQKDLIFLCAQTVRLLLTDHIFRNSTVGERMKLLTALARTLWPCIVPRVGALPLPTSPYLSEKSPRRVINHLTILKA